MAGSSSKKVILKSSDEEIFEVDEAIVLQSQTITHFIEACEDECHKEVVIPMENVTSNILSKVIEYCKKQVESEKLSAEKKKAWEKEFLKEDFDTVGNLCLAAHYMDINGLQDLTRQYIADCIKGKSVEEVRELLRIENDFTPEEEAKLREEESPWDSR